MNIFKFYFLLSLLFVAGCAHTGLNRVSTTQWLDSFEASGSFCIDGYVTNAAASGCKDWSVRNIEGVGEIRCSEKPEGVSNRWVDSTFVFFHPSNSQVVPGFHPLCADANLVFGVINL